MAELEKSNHLIAIDSGKSLDIVNLVEVKAKELFDICDKEGKGFINRADMQRLHGELALGDDQLREVFDQLDGDRNGFLTFQEFCDGFGGFLGMNSSYDGSVEHSNHFSETAESFHDCDHENTSFDLSSILSQLRSDPSFSRSSEDEVVDIWNRVASQDLDRPTTVEDFVQTIIRELNETKIEKLAVERKLKERAETHDDVVRQLSEEMEQQIKEERRKTIEEEVLRERSFSLELQNKLKQKEEYVRDVIAQQQRLEHQVDKLNTGKVEVKSENTQLLQLNESLAKELQKTRRDLEDTRIHMEMIKQRKQREEEVERAEEEARKLDIEKKSLITQLEVLRDVNRKLRDDKDEVIEQTKKYPNSSERRTSTPRQKYPLYTHGSNVGKYFPNDVLQSENLSDIPSNMNRIDEVCHSFENKSDETKSDDSLESSETEDNAISSSEHRVKDPQFLQSERSNQNTHRTDVSVPHQGKSSDSNEKNDSLHSKEASKSEHYSSLTTDDQRERTARSRFYKRLSKQGPDHVSSGESENSEPANIISNHPVVEVDGRTTQKPLKPIVTDEYINAHSPRNAHSPPPAPDRVYKVVFVGNSGVGKTSFIHQFVSKRFQLSISATIGVDYQMKTLKIDEQSIALQLWDTAGQERYRSITKQYFRKADGIVVVYDVTNEKSFLAVRNWMQSVREGADPSAVILLIGNKNDVATVNSRQVTPKEGAKLAEEYGAMFSETSAKSGKNIFDSMSLFAGELTRLEDEQKESVLSLAASDDDISKTTSCCSGNRQKFS